MRPIRRGSTAPAGANSETRSGFTLAEIAVTIVIVGIALVLLLQGLGGAKAQAFYTRNLKIADQLARKTLGEVAAGVYADEAEFGLDGSYADEDQPDFYYEVYFGADNFPRDTDRRDRGHDSWAYQRDREERMREDEEREDTTNRAGEDEEDELREPYQQVLVRVTFPVMGDFENVHTIQEWIPWEQVYGPDEEEEEAAAEADGNEAATGTGGSGGGNRSSGSGGRTSR